VVRCWEGFQGADGSVSIENLWLLLPGEGERCFLGRVATMTESAARAAAARVLRVRRLMRRQSLQQEVIGCGSPTTHSPEMAEETGRRGQPVPGTPAAHSAEEVRRG
jgi:hypothetical protein